MESSWWSFRRWWSCCRWSCCRWWPDWNGPSTGSSPRAASCRWHRPLAPVVRVVVDPQATSNNTAGSTISSAAVRFARHVPKGSRVCIIPGSSRTLRRRFGIVTCPSPVVDPSLRGSARGSVGTRRPRSARDAIGEAVVEGRSLAELVGRVPLPVERSSHFSECPTRRSRCRATLGSCRTTPSRIGKATWPSVGSASTPPTPRPWPGGGRSWSAVPCASTATVTPSSPAPPSAPVPPGPRAQGARRQEPAAPRPAGGRLRRRRGPGPGPRRHAGRRRPPPATAGGCSAIRRGTSSASSARGERHGPRRPRAGFPRPTPGRAR